MILTYSQEHEDLRLAVRRLLDTHGTLERTREAVESGAGHDPVLWKGMADDLGLHGLAIDEQHEGSGFGAVELAVALEEMGRQNLASPFLSSVVLAGTVLTEARQRGPREQRDRWLAAIATGDLVATVAWAGSDADWEKAGGVTATIEGSDAVLHGAKHFVTDASAAGLFIVVAQADNAPVLAAVEAGAPGLSISAQPALDPTRPLGTVLLDAVRATVLATGPEALQVLDRLRDVTLAALAAEQVGGAQRVLDRTVEYAKIREQFGAAIGSFQAIKFKAADMLLHLDAARSAAMYAARAVADRSEDLAVAAAVAKAVCSEAFFAIAAEAIQIHGGIGFTWEHDVHYYFKRAKSSELLFGAPTQHRERLAGLLGW